MRIVGNWRRIAVLGLGLAAAAVAPAAAQTVVVGGDWRPEIEVDPRVLDQLGPQPTLPDLLLGRQPMPPPGAAIKLHRPHATAAAGGAKPAKMAANPPAEANPGAPAVTPKTPKLAKSAKPMKVAEAAPPAGEAPPKAAKPAAPKSTKTLVSSFEPPPPPKMAPPTVVANADVPGAGTPEQKVTPPAVEPKAMAQTQAAKPAAAAPAKTLTDATATTPPPAQVTAPPPPAAVALPTTPTPPAAPPPPSPAQATPVPVPSAPVKQAMLTPPPTNAVTESGGALSIAFAKDSAELGDDGKNALLGVAKRATADPAIQVQVIAYASGDEDNASKARRLSLARALVVRSFLKDQNVPSARIEVRALGNKVPDGPPDRVDLVEQKH